MNRFRKVVLYGAVLNLLVLFLFPPYDVMAFGRGAPMFDAFHPVFAVPPNRILNGDVLYLFSFAVLINAAMGWLLLAGPKGRPEEPRVNPQLLVIVFGMLNLGMALLFPPMEAFPFAQRITVGTFDGFYFAFGDKARRSLFVPLLYMEVLYVLTNACAFWLAMSVAARSGPKESGPLTMLAQSDALRERAEEKLLGAGEPVPSASKRGPDRRKHHDPAYKGPERRAHGDRRHFKS
ncbi:MAG: hypothetical protein JSS40_12470 [Proteobacteria bacterium]|nr:hypothetical protein [Pseudomonadota bacterium]